MPIDTAEIKMCISSFPSSIEDVLTHDVKLEVAIQKLKGLCQARYEYNYHLSQFLLTSTPEQAKQYVIQTLGFWFYAHMDSTYIKNTIAKAVVGDCKLYKKILEKINTESHTQILVDYLHFELNQYLVGERYGAQVERAEIDKFCKKTNPKSRKKMIATQKAQRYREIDFLPECIATLEEVISEAQQAFSRETSIDVVKLAEEKLCFTMKEPSFHRLNNCKIMLKFFVNNMESLPSMRTEIDRILNEEVSVMEEIEPDQSSVVVIDWEMFHKIYALQQRLRPSYIKAQNFLRQTHDHITAEHPASTLTIHVDPAGTSETAVANTLTPTVVLEQQEGTATVVRDQNLAEFLPVLMSQDLDCEEQIRFFEEDQDEKAISEIKQYEKDAKQKISEYKFKVETEREARRILKLAKRKAIGLTTPREQPYAVIERKRKVVFSLLVKLNNSNLDLLQLILSKPTPHLQVSYTELENLFGYDTGKLQGCVSSMSGSHRKIIIHNVTGFFDIPSTSDNTETSQAARSSVGTAAYQKPVAGGKASRHSMPVLATGGTFKAHNAGHNDKLPSVAIGMLVGTLARANIDTNSLSLFLAAKQKALLNPQYSMENTKGIHSQILMQILKAAKVLEKERGMLLFLRKICKKEKDQPSVMHQLFGPSQQKSRNKIVETIFKYL